MTTIFDPRTEDEKEAASMLWAIVEPEVLNARKAAIRDALRVPNADVREILKEGTCSEEFTQRMEQLIVRIVDTESSVGIYISLFDVANDLIDAAARDGLAEAVAKECAERAR